jgi:hypothetical protein
VKKQENKKQPLFVAITETGTDNKAMINPEDSSFYEILERAISNPDVNAAKLQVLFDMQKHDTDKVAKAKFFKSMVWVQEQLQTIPEDKENEQTHTTYSSYKALLSHVKPFYIEAGFALVFSEEDATRENEIRICVDVIHEAGYSKHYHTEIPMDDRGIKGVINKTKPHAKGSSISYGRSYLMKMIFNLLTGEADDNNGNGTGGALGTADDKQIKKIKDLREALSLSEVDFKKRLKKRFNTDCPRNLTFDEAKELIRALTLLKKG